MGNALHFRKIKDMAVSLCPKIHKAKYSDYLLRVRKSYFCIPIMFFLETFYRGYNKKLELKHLVNLLKDYPQNLSTFLVLYYHYELSIDEIQTIIGVGGFPARCQTSSLFMMAKMQPEYLDDKIIGVRSNDCERLERIKYKSQNLLFTGKLEEIIYKTLIDYLTANAWNKTRTAKILGISVRTLRNWVVKFNLTKQIG